MWWCYHPHGENLDCLWSSWLQLLRSPSCSCLWRVNQQIRILSSFVSQCLKWIIIIKRFEVTSWNEIVLQTYFMWVLLPSLALAQVGAKLIMMLLQRKQLQYRRHPKAALEQKGHSSDRERPSIPIDPTTFRYYQQSSELAASVLRKHKVCSSCSISVHHTPTLSFITWNIQLWEILCFLLLCKILHCH